MASLQDQLLKAGLVDKNKANKAKKEKQKQAKVSRKGGEKTADEMRLAAEREQARKTERDRELNRQKQLASNQKALQAQIRQLIQLNRVDREGGDLAYSFVDQDKVKNIHVSEELTRYRDQHPFRRPAAQASARRVIPYFKNGYTGLPPIR